MFSSTTTTTTKKNLKVKTVLTSGFEYDSAWTTENDIVEIPVQSWDSTSNDSWDSSQSNYESVSYNLRSQISSELRRFNIESRDIVFPAGGAKPQKKINNKRRRAMTLEMFKKQSARKVVKDLVKFYNMHGYLTNANQYKYIDMCMRTRRRWVMRVIKWHDVSNIMPDKFNNKIMLNLAMAVRNHKRLVKHRQRVLFDKNHAILNRIDWDVVNPYLSLSVEEGIEVAYDATSMIAGPTKPRNIRVKIWDDHNQIDSDRVYRETTIPERNMDLLAKLHIILKRFLESRKPKQFREEIQMELFDNIPSCSSAHNIQPEMMEPEKTEQQQNAGAVVLNALQQDETTVTVVEDNDAFWINSSTSDQIVNVKHASSMEVMAKQFKWSSDDVSNYNIFNMDLPYEVIHNNSDHPASMLFNQYSYWNGDIRIRIHINTTPFHVGKLIFSWYYSQKFDENHQSRNNIASSVLLPHVCFDASVGDDVIINIPFKNYRSMLCTKKKQFDSLYMYLGTLRCHVFNPLVLSTGTTVDGYVHISFVNNNFTGISPRITIQPEMLSINSMIKTVEKTLTIADKITNMDKPSQVAPPIMYTPQFTDSFASGTGDINNVHALRLNPTGLTQHPSGSSTSISETLISSYISNWGLLRTLIWDTSMVTGRNMYRMPATPELAYNQYYKVTYQQGGRHVNAFVLPPLSVIAGINAYNRGSIEYKIEFINSRYHTGALVISFTPVQQAVTFNQALQSYNSTLDLGNTNSYVFRIPYINERPYNPRYNRELSNNIDPLLAPIGEVNMFILNQLRAVTGTSDKVYINIYIRAGSDFEFAVPVSPLYTINMDIVNDNPVDFVHADSISKLVGLATWRYMDKIANKAVVGKFNNGDDQIMQMYNLKWFSIYQKDWQGGITTNNIVCNYLGNEGQVLPVRLNTNFEFCAKFVVNGDKDQYYYTIFFQDQQHALEYVHAHYKKYSSSNLYPDSPTISEWLDLYPNQTAFYLTCNDTYVNWLGTAEQFRYKFLYSIMPQNQVNEIIVNPTTSTLNNLNSGYRMFGEQFKDLKDYCRRYQPYASFKLTINKNIQAMVARVPLTPIGLDISNTTNSTLLPIIKEGLIPYIISSYRFYRGGLRFKIIVTNYNGVNEKAGDNVFYIQHKPDIIVDSRDVKMYNISQNSKQALFQTGYAYSALSTSVNNSLTIEVPCYIPTNLLMLQKPDFTVLSEILHYTLGVLDIYVKRPTSTESGDYLIDIHYAFADDMDMSCFVGVPPVTATSNPIVNNVSEWTPIDIQPEVDDEKPSSSNVKDNTKQEAKSEDKKDAAKVESQGFWQDKIATPFQEKVVKKVKGKLNNYLAKQSCEVTREVLQLEPTQGEDTLWKVAKDSFKKFGNDNKHLIISIVSNITHLVVNPTISTLAITIIAILAHIGLESTSYLSRFTDWVAKLFGREVQPESQDADDNKTEKSSIDEAKSSIISSIVEMSASTFGKGKSFLKNLSIPDFSSKLFTNIRLGSLTINSCIILIKNLCEFVPKVFSWLGKIINPKAWYRWLFFNESKFIKRWVSDVEWMLDPRNRTAVNSQVKYNYQIQLLVIIGRDLVSKNVKLNNNDNFRYINDLHIRLTKLYEEIALTNIGAGNIGIEPFCFCLHGKSQIGKTYITKALAANCLKSINYQTDGEIFYTRPLTTKHWDGVQNEPVCIYDDFAQVKTDQSISDTIGEFIILKSKATFTPPRAHLQDKGRKYSPLIVALTMNQSHPKFDQVFATNDAWQNRRDLLIEVEFKAPKEYPNASKVQDLPEDKLDNFEHVMFSVHTHVNSGDSNDVTKKEMIDVPIVENGEFVKKEDGYEMISTIYVNYKQINWYMAKVFSEKYAKMHREYLKDLELMKSFYPSESKSFEVNLKEYVNFVKENRKLLNSREKETISMAEKMSGTVTCNKCKKSADCTCDLSIFDVDYISPKVQAEGAEDTVAQIADKYVYTIQTRKAYFDIMKELDKSLRERNGGVISFFQNSLIEYKEFLQICELYIKQKKVPEHISMFLSRPCIHLWLIIKKGHSHFSIDVSDKQFYLMYKGDETPIEYYTQCCIGKILDPKATEIYKKKIVALYAETGYRYNLPEEFIKQQNLPRVPYVYSQRYLNKMKKLQEEFYAEIDKPIKPSTWLGKVGAIMYVIAKPLLAVLAFCLSAFAITKVYSAYSKYTNANKLMIEYMEQKKLIDADALKKHAVSEKCISGGCDFCRVLPQMAYNAQQNKDKKNKPQVTPKQAEMALDIQKSLDIALRRNYFFIVATTSYGTETLCRCLGIKSWSFICIDHYIDKIKSLPLNTTIELRTDQLVKAINLSEIVFKKLKNSALIIGQLPRHCTQFKDISTKFVNASAVPNLHKTASLYVADLPLNRQKIEQYNITWHKNIVNLHADQLSVPHIIDSQNLEKATHIDYYWSYQTSGKGMCGSILISDMNTSSPLMGIHIAGDVSGGRGYAEVVCRETVENVLSQINENIVDIEIEGQMFDDVYIEFNKDPQTVTSALEGNFNFIGTVPNKYAYRPPIKSKNIHSMCYNQITKSTYDSPHLSHRDTRFEGSPMVNGCQYHTMPVIDFPDKEFNIVRQMVEEFILAKVRPQRQRIGKLTIEQSICGIPSIPNFDAMEFSTSEGFPFTTIRPKGAHDKRWLFDLSEDENGYHLYGLHNKLTAVMEYKHNLRKQGIVPMTIFTDCLKDLKLPQEKCHKTRIFSISPVDFTVQFRQYFYDFTISFQNTLLNVESAVGINVDSYEWHDMVQALINNSEHFVCGDYSKFGPRLMSKCVLAAFDIIIQWYIVNGDTSEENKIVRRIMALETAFSKHLMLNMVYEVVCGAPSGCPITTILNNIVNMLYIRMAYLTILRQNYNVNTDRSINLSSFSDNICIFFYGDDLIMTVKEQILDIFNASTISQFFKKYDITFTDALKTGELSLSTHVFARETSFLKRNIKRHPFRPIYVAAMDTRAIEETCNWIFEGHEEPEASIIACESMLLNAFGHGPSYYDSLRNKVILFWRSINIYPRIPLWVEVDWRIYEGMKY